MPPADSQTDSAPLRRIAFVGSYVPRKCGIGTFTQDLCESVAAAAPTVHCFVGAVNDRAEGYAYPPRVTFEFQEKDIDSYRQAADFVNFNNTDVLCVQHEFGIFGGPAGSHLLALLKDARMPVVTTLHSVLREPDLMQRRVMEELVRRSDRLVVMARKGAEILLETYGVPEAKIAVIPHGIPDIPFVDSSVFKAQFDVEGRQVLLTFGLLGPSKGVEHVIQALPEIVKLHPDVAYLVLGATHPRLVAREGERYRLKLERLADDLGVKDHVIFYNRYVSLDNLKEFIGATDIYLTPYLNEAQITSGTLAYVFGAGKAVVSTPYWHAQELLADGRGILVPFSAPPAIARAVCALLDDPDRMAQIRRDAYALGREMIWPEVAKRYLEVFRQAQANRRKTAPRPAPAGPAPASRHYELPPLRLDHILRMSDDTGLLQHAMFNVPNFHEGYCTDDNARAFILCILLDEISGQPAMENLDKSGTHYLAFLVAAFDPVARRFRNFMNHRREWREEPGSEDCHGRALWALGTGAGRARPEGHGRLSARLFKLGLGPVADFSSPRAWASTLLGIHEYLRVFPSDAEALAMRELLIGKLVRLWETCATADWPWFEPIVSYDNARLSQALIIGGRHLSHPEAFDIGIKSLHWLAALQKTPAGHFRPVGSNGFYPRGGALAYFDQQPVDAQAMVSASLEAFHATRDLAWLREARRAFEWFLGRNDLGLPLYDFSSGGCCDGLHADRINENQGSESSLAFLLSLAEMNQVEPPNHHVP